MVTTMYKRRKTGGARRKRLAAGRGFFSKIWSGIKSIGKPIVDLAKKSKIVSTVVAPALAARNPALGSIVGSVANSQGYGARKRVRRRRVRKVGGSLFSKLRTAMRAVKPYASRLNSHLKSSKFLSKELKNKGYHTASSVLKSLGYGKSRKRVGGRKKRVVRRGRGAGGVSGSLGNSFKANKSIIRF